MYKSPAISSTISLSHSSVHLTAKLADGVTCEVFKAVGNDGREVAIKLVPFAAENPTARSRYLREAEVLSSLPPHSNVTRLYDCKEERDKGALAVELCAKGSLKTLCKTQELAEQQVLAVLKDVATALAHVHGNGVAHRDLRPGNILLGNDFKCRLSDFGSATRTFHDSIPDSEKSKVLRDIETSTPPSFRAPEQADPQLSQPLTTKVDIWGLGCLVYGLLFRENAFTQKSVADLRAGRYKRSEKKVSALWTQLLDALFAVDPAQRATAERVLELCAEREVPRVIPNGEAPPPLAAKYASIVDLFKNSTGTCVRAATTNIDAYPDFHYIWKLVSKCHLKPFKAGKIFTALQKRPSGKTRVAIKTLMATHLFLLSGGPVSVSQQDSGSIRVIETVERLWLPNAGVQGDELRCEYFSGLIRQYAKMLKFKAQFHAISASKGDWSGGRIPDQSKLAELITLWSKLMHLSKGLFMGVTELLELRTALAGLLMEEKVRLMKYVGDGISAISRVRTAGQSSVPELMMKFQENYKKTYAMAVSLRRFRPTLNYTIPPEEYQFSEQQPEPQHKRSNTADRTCPKVDPTPPKIEIPMPTPLPTEPSPETTEPVLQNERLLTEAASPIEGRGDRPRSAIKSRGTSQPPEKPVTPEEKPKQRRFNPFLSPATPFDSNRSKISEQGPMRTGGSTLPDFASSGGPYPSSVQKAGDSRRSNSGAPQPDSSLFDDLLNPPTRSDKTPQSAPMSLHQVPPAQQLASNRSVRARVKAQDPPMSPAPAMINLNTPQPQPNPEVKMFSPDSPWILKQNQLQFGPILGVGSSCKVYRGLYKRTPVAIKVMQANVVNVDIKREFVREVTAMLSFRHPNLVLFMGACIDCQLAIITEFCAGESLFKLLHERKDVMLSWPQKLKMCKDVAHGMNYLHESTPPIIHRDLKSLNLLLHEPVLGPSDNILVKITDFGVAKILDEPTHMTGQMGTCHWMAPEVLANKPYNLSADVYSFGIVLWEIVCRDTPYRTISPMQIAERVVRFGERPNLAMVPSSCPPALRDLMTRCWQTDPAKRPTFSQVLDELEHIEV